MAASRYRRVGCIVRRVSPAVRAGECVVLLEEGIRNMRDFTLLPIGKDGIALSKCTMKRLGWEIGDEIEVTLRRLGKLTGIGVVEPVEGEEAVEGEDD
jgi:hypothetical protein